jgi:hypothetical protein
MTLKRMMMRALVVVGGRLSGVVKSAGRRPMGAAGFYRLSRGPGPILRPTGAGAE